MDIQFLSAKDLCIRSAMQLKMFLEKPHLRPQPNQNQWDGVNYQYATAKKIKNVVGEEMGNYIEVDNFRLYFTNDIITSSCIIEIKHIDPLRKVEEWYLQSCFMQCAIYYTLSDMVNYAFQTAKFFVNQGNDMKRFAFDNKHNVRYILMFGDTNYEIKIHNFTKIKEWIIQKILSLQSWESAKEFDNKYKRKEYDYLRNFFTVHQLKHK